MLNPSSVDANDPYGGINMFDNSNEPQIEESVENVGKTNRSTLRLNQN